MATICEPEPSRILAGHGISEEVRRPGRSGAGICNGFQILCEAGLLPGALMRNVGLKYVCKPVHVRVENADTPFTRRADKGEVLHHSHRPHGRQLLLRPSNSRRVEAQSTDRLPLLLARGRDYGEANPNGSLDNIAGICSPGRNVLGMMPHPERSARTNWEAWRDSRSSSPLSEPWR